MNIYDEIKEPLRNISRIFNRPIDVSIELTEEECRNFNYDLMNSDDVKYSFPIMVQNGQASDIRITQLQIPGTGIMTIKIKK